MPGVHSHLDVFDDRNAFLLVTLGLASACEQALELVVAAGPAAEPPAISDEDPVLDAALGLAALASAVLGRLHAVVDQESRRPSRDVPSTPAPEPVVLRRLLA